MNRILLWINKNYKFIIFGFLALFLALFFIPYNFDILPNETSENLYHSVFPIFKEILTYFEFQYISGWIHYSLIPVFFYFIGLALVIADAIFSWKKPKLQMLFGFAGYVILFIGLIIGSFPGFAHHLHVGFFIPILAIMLYLAYFSLNLANSYLTTRTKHEKPLSDKDRIAQLEREVAELKASKKDDE